MIENYFSGEDPLYIFLPNNGCGGAEKLSIDLAEVEQIKGRRVTLVFANLKGDLAIPQDIKMINLNKDKASSAFFPLLKALPKENFTLFTTMYHCNIICCGVKILKSNFTLIIRESTSFNFYKNNFSPFKYFLLKILIQIFYPFAEKVIFPSEQMCKLFLKSLFFFPKKKIHVKRNPINTKKSLDLAEESIPRILWQKKARHVFINVGRLDKNKNQRAIIIALNEFKEMNFELLLLGTGPEREKLKELVTELGLASKVHFLGFQDNPFKFLKVADTFILSSLSEGYPNVLVQAKLFNLNIISTDCPTGPAEILRGYKKGHLVDLNFNAKDVLNKILHL